jgi:hypothetical protein
MYVYVCMYVSTYVNTCIHFAEYAVCATRTYHYKVLAFV